MRHHSLPHSEGCAVCNCIGLRHCTAPWNIERHCGDKKSISPNILHRRESSAVWGLCVRIRTKWKHRSMNLWKCKVFRFVIHGTSWKRWRTNTFTIMQLCVFESIRWSFVSCKFFGHLLVIPWSNMPGQDESCLVADPASYTDPHYTRMHSPLCVVLQKKVIHIWMCVRYNSMIHCTF